MTSGARVLRLGPIEVGNTPYVINRQVAALEEIKAMNQKWSVSDEEQLAALKERLGIRPLSDDRILSHLPTIADNAEGKTVWELTRELGRLWESSIYKRLRALEKANEVLRLGKHGKQDLWFKHRLV